MTYKQSIKYIVKNWETLHAKQNDPKVYNSWPKEIVAVWCANSDISEAYSVDQEMIGVTPQGNIAWAYASGCSCWDGDYSVDHKPTVKELTLDHKHLPEDWEKAIIKFAETGEVQQMPSYSRYEY